MTQTNDIQSEFLYYENKEIFMQRLKEVLPRLTKRQLECLFLYFLGFTQQEIGYMMRCDQRTTSDYLDRIWSKFDEWHENL